MKEFLFILSAFISYTVSAQTAFNTVIGSTNRETGQKVFEFSGGYIIGGTAFDSVNTDADFQLSRISSVGSLMWSKKIGGQSREIFTDMIIAPDGGYVLTGGFTNSIGNSGVLVIKTDSLGDTLWSKYYSAVASIEPNSICATSDGGFAILGRQDSVNSTGTQRAFLLKCDAQGVLQWMNLYDLAMIPTGVVQCPNGDFAVVGSIFLTANNFNRTIVIRTDSNGLVIWTMGYTSAVSQYPKDVDVYNKNIAIAGYEIVSQQGDIASFVLLIGVGGNILWERRVNFGTDQVKAETVVIDGSMVLAAGSLQHTTGTNGFLIRFSLAGVFWGSYEYVLNANTEFYSADLTSDGRCILTGNVNAGFGPADSASTLVIKSGFNMNSVCSQTNLPISVVGYASGLNIFAATSIPVGTESLMPVSIDSGAVQGDGCPVGIRDDAALTLIKIYPCPTHSEFLVELSDQRDYFDPYFVLVDPLGRQVMTAPLMSTVERIPCAELSPGMYFYYVLDEDAVLCTGRLIKE